MCSLSFRLRSEHYSWGSGVKDVGSSRDKEAAGGLTVCPQLSLRTQHMSRALVASGDSAAYFLGTDMAKVAISWLCRPARGPG